ncbi:S1 RNA-binding domain-containing protein [Lachnoclostridium edouardi]|uniref:S1 RNA-binding domain-containing protein n=1 Tax=Lachnoclostridium edouardi TaxID=1926283 RepID=UPI000C7A9EE0|nr:S1 RNA-binding domain-containing protein [Lachnoclostridium edouardi]
MATKKKELLEQESVSMECELNTEEVSPEISLEATDEAVTSPATDSTENEPDLDELLSIMDEGAEASAPSDPSESAPPELSEANPIIELETGDLPSDTATETVSVKPKRTTRKKAELAETEQAIQTPDSETESDTPTDKAMSNALEESSEAAPTEPETSSRNRKTEASVLTIESRGAVETEETREDVIWHEIHNAYRTRKILTGQLGGIEQTDAGKTIAIVDYKGFRIVIPLKEMMINLGRSPSGQEYTELMLRQNKVLGNMLGAEIDFIVKGIDSRSRSVVASRKDAMLKKRQIFYLDTDASGLYRIYDGRIVQARVIAVAEKVIRVEIFGVECSIMARDLAWDWIGDAHERFSVGDQVLVRILSVRRDSLEDIGVKADIKSVSQNTNHDNLKKCRIQSKYAGKVTDVHKGVVYIRLSNGVNAVAHSCYDYRTPGKKDDVSFAVTRLDEERGVAVGIITRIIRQNL